MPLDEGSGDSASPAILQPSDERSAQQIHPVRCLWSPWSLYTGLDASCMPCQVVFLGIKIKHLTERDETAVVPCRSLVGGDVVSGGLVLRHVCLSGPLAEGGQNPLPRPRQRRQDHAAPHAQGRGTHSADRLAVLDWLHMIILVLAGRSTHV